MLFGVIRNCFGITFLTYLQRTKEERIVPMPDPRGVVADQTEVVLLGKGHLLWNTPEVSLKAIRGHGFLTCVRFIQILLIQERKLRQRFANVSVPNTIVSDFLF